MTRSTSTWTDRFLHAVIRMEHNRPCASTIARHQFEWWGAQVSALAAERPQEAGLLTERYSLVRRLAAARKAGQDRPELKVRLRVLNRELAAVKGLTQNGCYGEVVRGLEEVGP
jgi:hypothetical protein